MNNTNMNKHFINNDVFLTYKENTFREKKYIQDLDNVSDILYIPKS